MRHKVLIFRDGNLNFLFVEFQQFVAIGRVPNNLNFIIILIINIIVIILVIILLKNRDGNIETSKAEI